MAAEHHTVMEARELLERMSTEDWEKARIFALTILKNSRVERTPVELVNEAVLRTLEGKRQWKVGLSGPSHLFGTMKSILSAWNKADVRFSRAMSNLRTSREDGEDLGTGYVDADLATQLRELAGELMADPKLKPTSRAVLQGILAGQSRKDLMRDLNLDAKKLAKAVLALSKLVSARTADQEEVS